MMKQQANKARLKKILLLPNQKQSGFIQAVILFGIALIAAVIGAFALSGKGATKSTSSEEAKLAAATLIKQAGDLQEAIQRYRSDRGGFGKMTFSTDADTGLFNPTDRFATQLIGPAKGYVTKIPPVNAAIKAGNKYGSWSLNNNVTINGIASNWVVVTTGLSKVTCQRINNLIYGALSPATNNPVSAGSEADWQGLDTAITVPNTGNWPSGATEGCVATTSKAANPETGVTDEITHAYFKVVNERGAN